MKKFLLSMAAVAMTCGAATATEVTLNVKDATDIQGTVVDERAPGTTSDKDNGEAKHVQPLESFKLGDFSFTLENPQNKTKPAYYYAPSWKPETAPTVRVYTSNTMTITAPAGVEITQIDFSGSNGKKDTAPEVSTGAIAEGVTASKMTWTGSASAITFTYTNNFRIQEMVITYGNATMETVEAPTFEPASGATFTEEIAVSIKAAEGATVYYTLDGTNPTTESDKYEAPLTLKATTTVKAFAVKEGMNPSGVVSATYTKMETMETLQELIVAGLDDEQTEFTYTGKAVVTYQNGSNLFVRDDSAALLIYGSLGQTYGNGDVITGFAGTFKNYYSTWELMANASTFAASTEKGDGAPKEMQLGSIKPDDQNQYVIIKGAGLTADKISDESGSMTVYNKFKVEIPETATLKDVTAIVSYYQAKGADAPELQIYPIEIKDATGIESIDVDNLPAGAEVYSISGVRVNSNELSRGIYVVLNGGKAHKILVK